MPVHPTRHPWHFFFLLLLPLVAHAVDSDFDGLEDDEEALLGTDPLSVDTDGDFLSDFDEVAAGTDPLNTDTDSDGLSDFAEVATYGSDPLDPDTDNGGSIDGEEVLLDGTDPNDGDDDLLDSDNDGLTNAIEIRLGTDPFNQDTDGDLVSDGEEDANQNGVWDGAPETNPLDPDSDDDGLHDGLEAFYGTDPFDPDSEDDGLEDGAEYALALLADADTFCLDPFDPDSDNDGVTDGDEANVHGTSPCNPDSDDDGLYDIVEIADGTDPNNDAEGLTDTDGDGLSDRYEEEVSETDSLEADQDGDGLDDAEEILQLTDTYLTDPDDADTDDDGILDGNEVIYRTSPVDFDSDGDELSDGVEVGLTEPETSTKDLDATDPDSFEADIDPDSTTSPLKADTDNDTLSDGEEDFDHDGLAALDETDPNLFDTDGDSIDDGWETLYGHASACDPTVDKVTLPLDATDAHLDIDEDGLTNFQEYVLDEQTNPCDPDTDDDLLPDGTEVNGLFSGGPTSPIDSDSDNDGRPDGIEDANQDGLWNPATETDPTLADTDSDGLSDGEEDLNGNGIVDDDETDPLLADSDGDDLSDGLEQLTLGTDPRVADTDGDGLSDGLESGKDGDADTSSRTNPLLSDSDGDGLPDGVEDANQDGAADPFEPNPLVADTDGDGLVDGQEDLDGDGTRDVDETDPTVADTDGGGVSDGTEILVDLTDPLDGLDDLTADPDGDGLINSDEKLAGTDPLDPDTDGDSIDDLTEVGPDPSTPRDSDTDSFPDARDLDSDNDTMSDAQEAGDNDIDTAPVDTDSDGTPDYRDTDSDGGGTPDLVEVIDRGTDPLDPSDDREADTDGDGLSNSYEEAIGTDPDNPDTDGDTISDGQEHGDGEEPRDNDLDGVIDALDLDSDDDRLPDADEAGDADLTTDPIDTDEDGLADFRDLDSDGGGIFDEVESFEHGTDPLDPSDDGHGFLEGELYGGCAGCSGSGAPVGWLWLMLPLLLWSRRAMAQDSDAETASIDSNTWTVDPGGHTLLGTGDARILNHLQPAGQAIIQHADRSIIVYDGTERVRDLVRLREQLTLSGAIGIAGRFEAGLSLPIIVYQKGELPGLGLGNTPTTGIGDLGLHLKGQIWDFGPVALAASAPVWLPSGNKKAWMGSGGLSAEPRLHVSGDVDIVHWFATFGYRIQPETVIGNIVDDNKITYRLGTQLYLAEGATGELAYLGHMRADAPLANAGETAGEVNAAARYDVHKFLSVTGGLGTSFWARGVGTPTWRVFAGVTTPWPNKEDMPEPPEPEIEVEPEPEPEPEPEVVVEPELEPEPEVEPEAEPQPETPHVELTPTEILVDGRILFKTGTALLQPESYPLLDQVLTVMLEHSGLRIRIEGHTDSVGNADSNQTLSHERAGAVRRYLMIHSDPEQQMAKRVTAVGKGETEPVAANTTPEGRAQNRRVVFAVVE
jgi:outer membrane protein OmpA-like peptidoglycan-associated protein